MSACCATGQNSQPLFEVVWSGQDVRTMHVIHLLTTKSIIMDKTIMSSRIRPPSCTHVASCHVMFNLAWYQSTINLHHAATDTMLNANHLVHATLDHFLQAGTQWRACSACSRGQDSGQRPSSASTSCKPRCLLLAARLQQTRLIEPTLYPNFVVRGLHRTHAGHSQSLNIGCPLIAIYRADGRNK